MPRLLVFAVSEKCITNKDDDTSSLITLVTGLSISVPAGQTISEDAVLPISLAATALWIKTDGDEGKEYESKVELVSPNESVAGVGGGRFEFLKRAATVKVVFPAFPVGIVGVYHLRLYMREVKDPPAEWVFCSDYPIEFEQSELRIA